MCQHALSMSSCGNTSLSTAPPSILRNIPLSIPSSSWQNIPSTIGPNRYCSVYGDGDDPTNTQHLLGSLPQPLRAEVLATMYRSDLLSCAIFGEFCEAQPGFLDSLLVAMKCAAALPGEKIVVAHSVATDVFFLRYNSPSIAAVRRASHTY